MPTYTTLPRPEGHIRFSYNPMSPGNWGMVPFELHFYVYRDVKVALQALLQSAATIQAQNLEAGKASLFTDNIYFRGHTDVTHRLLPTRLRTASTESGPRQRFAVPGGPPGQDPREEYGDWSEEVEGMRSASKTVANLTDEELRKRRCVLRVRVECGKSRLTFKGPVQPGIMKIREELETVVSAATGWRLPRTHCKIRR